ncbi:MAG: dihydrofolate reductase family protein [Motilibacteraceae bacterium]
MSRTIYYTASSLDGFLADPENSLDWLFEVDTGGESGDDAGFGEFFAGIGAMAMGATTYQWVLDHEDLLAHPERWTASYGTTPCWVFTHRDLPLVPGGDVRLVHGDVGPVHAQMLEAAAGKDVWLVGGGGLAGQFADAGLLDELQVQLAPVTLGAGAPLLPRRLLARDLTLTAVGRQGQLALLTYAVRRAG